MGKLYDTAAERNDDQDAGAFDHTKCGRCGMSLPMAGGQPLAEACLKCNPGGPAKQKKQGSHSEPDGDDDKPDKNADVKDDHDEDDETEGFDSGDDDQDDDEQDDEDEEE